MNISYLDIYVLVCLFSFESILINLFLCVDFLCVNSNNLRAIPEAEIGLAVIFMSTEIYCNPQRQPDNKGDWKKGSSKLTAIKK